MPLRQAAALVTETFQQILVGIDAAITQERPLLTQRLGAGEIDAGDQYRIPIGISLYQ